MPNPAVPAPSSTVGVVRTADPTSDAAVADAVRRTVDSIGGVAGLLKPGDTVVLKPNQGSWLGARDGATTDPRVVAALVDMCKRAGAGRITVGDSAMGDLRTSAILDHTGMRRACLKAGADAVVAFEDEPQADVQLKLPGGRIDRAPVARLLLEANLIINVAKAKTHFLEPVMGCLANWVGLIGQEERPRFMSEAILFDIVAALHAAVPARLHVVDGFHAGEGNGPMASEGFWLGCAFAGHDPVAVDATVSRAMGVAPWELRYVRAATAQKLGVADPAKIRVIGSRLEEISRRAKRARPGVEHYPARVLVGQGVSWAGTLGHFKALADLFDKVGAWQAIERIYGRPTFMIGAVEDSHFDSYVSRGPYFVLDDAARVEYKEDPRVEFIPGHPATHNIMPHLMRRLRVERLSPKFQGFLEVMKKSESYFHYRSWRKAAAIDAGERVAKPLG